MVKDPYKYFRVEARELVEGLSQGILQLEQEGAAPEVIARLLRLAHTLKGAARVVRQARIAELAHTIEGILGVVRELGRPLTKDQGSELLQLLDEISAQVAALAAAGETTVQSPVQAVSEEPIETLRVQMGELDSLLRGVTEAGVQLGALRKGLGTTEQLRDQLSLLRNQLAPRANDGAAAPSLASIRARFLAEDLKSSFERFQRTLATDLERLDGELTEVREVAHQLRLIPARTVFPQLARAVRDAAQALGKQVSFETFGGDVRLDANVLSSLRDALMHVVRNAVTHGVESPAARAAARKPPAGRVCLAVERRGNRVAFVCSDDGRGVVVEAVRNAAVARGRLSAADARAFSDDQVIALLLGGGLTTSNQLTELSGRGIGLDVVRTTAAALKGELRIRSESGRGATVELEVPVSIVSLHGLIVEASGTCAVIPLDAIRQTLRVHERDVARSAHNDSILHEGQVIPFLPLDRALRRPGAAAGARTVWSAVVVQADRRSVAVGVDRLLGTANIVVRPLPRLVDADPVVAGASLDAEGNPQLVLDPSGLVAAAERGRNVVSEQADARRLPVLVIDDSLTTRMLEQSILESAGYEVALAVCAEDGLAMARERHYGLFIVDVEMPGMDGFAFVAQTRADPTLRDTPAILVTSRNAVEDRQRGQQVGASAYIVKGEFDQQHLLQTIRTLLG